MVPGGFLAEGAPTCEDVPTFGDTVITSRPEPIRHFVTETLGRTATQQDATGVYTGEPRTIDAFIRLVKPYGIQKLVRTGITALARG